MSIAYRVYIGINAPPDYSAPIVTTSSLSADLPVVPPGSKVTAVVRAFDTVSGLEDQSTDARVVVLIGPEGDDETAFPRAPTGLTTRARSGGTCRVTWAYPINGGATGFHVYIGIGSPDYSAPVTSSAYDRNSPGRVNSVALAGLSNGVSYAVAVRAFNAAGEERNINVSTVVGASSGPSPAVALAAVVVP